MKKTVRIHSHLVDGVVANLSQSFFEGYYIDKVIERSFKSHKKWGARDRKFVAETTYDMCRWWSRLWAILGKSPVDDSELLLELFFVYWLERGNELPPWAEIRNDKLNQWESNASSLGESLEFKYAFPEWILNKLSGEVPEEDFEDLLHGLNEPAKVVLRVNLIKTNLAKLKKNLQEEGISTEIVDNYPDALVLSQRENVFRTNAFKEGHFEVQDGASQTVAPLLGVKPGERVIDACAGAGGKSLHLASLMENKGRLISLDIHDYKLKELKKRARRNSVSIIETRPIESTKVIKRLQEAADAVLLDVPCSGLGVLRRNPDTKWKLSEPRLDELKQIQKDILERYSKMCKKGGRLVYATCSILREENEEQVEAFLKANAGFRLVEDRRHFPHIDGFDGFYAALLERQ
ncbi:MAG: RsmB/NOP family class I SAM-dependent RNA methyltransferase [Bdellovibrionales bacterium]